MNRLSKAVMAALVDTVHGVPVWDAAPVLYRVYVRVGDRVELRPVAISAELWSTPHTGMRTPEVLDVIAGHMAAFGLADANVFGMAVCYEGWGVPGEVIASYHGQRQVAQMAGEHTLCTHPQRVEVRHVLAVDRRGISYMVEHRRGGGTRCELASPGRGEVQLAGSMIEALDRMVEHLTGVPAQRRRSSVMPAREAN